MKDVMRLNAPELTAEQKKRAEIIKREGNKFADYFSQVLPDCRETEIAKQKLEEAVMWAVKGITA